MKLIILLKNMTMKNWLCWVLWVIPGYYILIIWSEDEMWFFIIIVNMMAKFEEDDEELVVLGPLGDPWRPMSL